MSESAVPVKRMGRRPTHLPLAKIEAFCQIHATDEEIAAHFGVSTKTIQRLKKKPDYAAAFEKGRADGKISLRRAQYQEALKGSPSMLIWLGKQMLGQKDKHELSGANGGPVQIEQVRSMLDRLSEEDFAKLARDQGVDLQQISASEAVIDLRPVPDAPALTAAAPEAPSNGSAPDARTGNRLPASDDPA